MTRRHCSTSRSWQSTAPGVQPGWSFDLTVTRWSEVGGKRRKRREDAKEEREREREHEQEHEQEQARYQANETSPHLAANFGS